MKRAQKAYRTVGKNKNRLLPFLLGGTFALAILTVGSLFFYRSISKRIHTNPSIAMLKDNWKVYDYEAVYDISGALLEKNPFYNNTALTYRGYAAFYLALAATIPAQAQNFIDEAVRALRLAAMHAKEKTLPQIHYMLGKSYFYKNSIFSYHYYADMALKYLLLAKNSGYESDDISEYLGLCYAQLGMTTQSIAAFSEALLVRESDTLLLAIAEQYFKGEQPATAKQYLFRIIQRSDDDFLVMRSHALLGNILLGEEDFDGAEKEFEAIIEKNDNSAEAHYGLGLVYESRGNLAKARAEWRKTLRIQVNHADALGKIQYYR